MAGVRFWRKGLGEVGYNHMEGHKSEDMKVIRRDIVIT